MAALFGCFDHVAEQRCNLDSVIWLFESHEDRVISSLSLSCIFLILVLCKRFLHYAFQT